VFGEGDDDYAECVQRLFSMFPQGGPGLALLLLRISVAAIFVSNAAIHVGARSIVLPGAVESLSFLIAVCLILGFLTPILATIACAAAALSSLFGPHSHALIASAMALDAAALALLGPGAYSLDARLYGRRATVVPPR